MQLFKYYVKLFWEGILHSYAQVFFSNNKVFAYLLLIVSFFDFGGGLGSILAVLIAQLAAVFLHSGHQQIRDGSITYNSLMVGTAIGFTYEWNLSIMVLILVASLFTFLLTVWFRSILGNKYLPFLSIPFLLGVWVVFKGAGNFSLLQLAPKDGLSLFTYFPELLNQTKEYIATLTFANYLHLLFRSIGAIFFQYNDLAGIIILIGLFWQSRIATLLTIYSFTVGYLFYWGLAADFSNLVYTYIGFNFILTGIALGGFFVVPSKRSFLLVGLIIPITGLLISALSPIFVGMGLPLFSLPFNIVVLLTLMALGQRLYAGKLQLVTFQEYKPENHVYKHLRNINRYSKQTSVYISLPILGEWYVSQAHNGKHTHKGVFAFAYDFDIRNEKGETYQNLGTSVTDYLCYNLPVIAPASGYVVDLHDGIVDNEIGEVNMLQNWGNVIVIKHAEGLYSKLAHLKAGSFTVGLGDFVYKGQIIGRCGSSGRSPEPHLHFQLQTTPYVGSASFAYPISYYLATQNGKQNFKTFDFPLEGDWVKNLQRTKLLSETFNLIPGKRFFVNISSAKEKKETHFAVHTNAYNQTYLHCEKTDAVAYFVNDGICFYFTEFYGNKKSALYAFYEAAYKISLSLIPDLTLKDELLPSEKLPWALGIFQDLLAPFKQVVHVRYQSKAKEFDDPLDPKRLIISSEVKIEFDATILRTQLYQIEINADNSILIKYLVGTKKEKLIHMYVL